MKKHFVLFGLLLLLIIPAGCTTSEASETPKTNISELEILSVKKSNYLKKYEYPGLLNADKKVDLSSKFAGQVEDVYVNPGQEVEKGEILALIGDSEGNLELKVSLDNSKRLLEEMGKTFNFTKSANLKSIDLGSSKIEIEETNLKKAQDYRSDLESTYLSKIKQAETQVEKTRIMHEMANTGYENYLIQSESIEKGSKNQIKESNTYRNTLDTALDNAKDLADEIEDQAEESVERAEDLLDSAEDYLESLENNNASDSEIMKARIAVANAEMNLENAKAALERIELENDSNIDSIKENIKTVNTQFDGSMFQDQSTEVMISSKIDSLKYNQLISEQNYFESKNTLELLNSQMKQELNSADNDIELLKRSISNYKLNLDLTKENTKRVENEMITKIEELKGQINLLESKLKKQEIRAPFTGTISKKYIEIGESVNIDSVLFEITNMDKLTIEWYLPESKLNIIQKGKKVEVLFLDKNYEATITEIEPVAGKYSKKIRIEADLLMVPTGVVDNTYVEVILYEESQNNKIQIPLSSVILKYKDSFVYTLEDDSISLVPIKLGESIGGNVIVESGLHDWQKIILNPNKELKI